MKLKRLAKSGAILGVLLMMCSFTVSAAPYMLKKADNGIEIRIQDLRISLEVMSDNIIHVIKNVNGITHTEVPDYVTIMEPEGGKFLVTGVRTRSELNTDQVAVSGLDLSTGFSDYRRKTGGMIVAPSLDGVTEMDTTAYIMVTKAHNVRYGVEQDGDKVVLSTETVDVNVDVATGAITFNRKDGSVLVSESTDLTYIKPEGESEHSVSQAFVAGDEALYGLGQYQSGIMNWKNESVRMLQYNQEIVIPFMVSTNDYGIYWHNYSMTDFNRSQFEIFFKDAETAVETTNKSKSSSEAADQDVEDVKRHKQEQDKNKNIRRATFTPLKTGEYSFFVESNARMRGDIKVIIEGDTIINYTTVWMPTTHSASKELRSGVTYEIVYQNTGGNNGRLLYNEPNFDKSVFSSRKGGEINYYMVHGVNPGEVIRNYQKLTGTAPMFSKKSYGFWQCRERYHDQDELLTNAREMRKRNIPVDNIVQDWFYWPEDTKGPEWDRAKYPDPKAMTSELTKLNMNLMVSVWPSVNNDPLISNYKMDKYHFNKEKKIYNLDFYNPIAGEGFYKMLSDSMFKLGVKSIWLDGTEGGGSDGLMTAAGEMPRLLNTYSLLVTQAVYKGRRAEFPNERVFNLTRSAYAGQQRNGATSWSGDVASTWEQFAEQIPAGLNFTMAGVPYWTHDIGGFFRDSKSMNPIYDDQYTNKEFIELLTRWFQFGTFSPIFRIHGYVSETEIWRYGAEFEKIARKFIDLRYSLMPYIYSQAWQVTQNSRQLMAPMAYQYPDDKNCWELKDQYFFGESMLVAPVVEYKAREREVYLPNGKWYNFWSGEMVKGGGSVTAKAELNELPIFVKAGAIIPIGPKVQYATEPTDEPLHIKVYPGASGQFTLYLDDNESYDYESGKYTEVLFDYDDEDKKLTITAKYDEYENLKKKKTIFVVEFVGQSTTRTVKFNGYRATAKM